MQEKYFEEGELKYRYRRPYFAQWDTTEKEKCDIRDLVLIRDSKENITYKIKDKIS